MVKRRTPAKLTALEIAYLRYEAWQMLAGWGFKNPEAKDDNGAENKFKTWDFSERCYKARQLADWALEK